MKLKELLNVASGNTVFYVHNYYCDPTELTEELKDFTVTDVRASEDDINILEIYLKGE